jgi:DNA-binding transcriptional MerR regulator
MAQHLPDKLFFKIGEVAEIVGVRPHVLRYWESEMPALRPMKTRGAHRVYRRRDVELAMLVKRLLQDEGFTISGAKKRLRELNRDRVASAPDPQAAADVSVRASLQVIRDELRSLQDQLDAVFATESLSPRRGGGDMKATVTSSVESTVPMRGHRIG